MASASPGSLCDSLSSSRQAQSNIGPHVLMQGKVGHRHGCCWGAQGWGSTTSWGQAKGRPLSTAARAPFSTRTAGDQLSSALPHSSIFPLTSISTDFPSYTASSNFLASLPPLPRWMPGPPHIPLASWQELGAASSAITATYTSTVT